MKRTASFVCSFVRSFSWITGMSCRGRQVAYRQCNWFAALACVRGGLFRFSPMGTMYPKAAVPLVPTHSLCTALCIFFSQHHAAAQPCPRNPVVGLLEHSMRYSTAYNDGEPRALPRHRPKSPSHGTNRVIFCLGFFCSFVELALFQCPQHPADG